MNSSSSSSSRSSSSSSGQIKEKEKGYLPHIPVMMRHPYIVASVKQYHSDAQIEQLHTHIVSESFIPMAPNLIKPPRKRRRPPFSYSSLIAQAILESENERMTLRDIYKWITIRYPALYNAEDTGWQNTIRHNLSLNRCFKKVPKSELVADHHKGKGGFWTIDPIHMEKFKNGSFAKGSSSLMRRKPTQQQQQEQEEHDNRTSPSPSLPDTPVSSTETNDILKSTTTPSPSNNSEYLSIMQIHNLLN